MCKWVRGSKTEELEKWKNKLMHVQGHFVENFRDNVFCFNFYKEEGYFVKFRKKKYNH